MLHFIFKDGIKSIYDLEVEYCKNDDWIEFIADDNSFKFLLSDKVDFIKDSGSSTFEIRYDRGQYKGIYFIKEENIKVEVKVLEIDFKYSKDEYHLKYILESDEGIEKYIMLKKI